MPVSKFVITVTCSVIIPGLAVDVTAITTDAKKLYVCVCIIDK